ncbi:MAG: radical SAM protein [Richelia sp. RM2_1_2]|nr:radical SAM protein [Richelia sp. RM2_1_2]
MAEIIILTDLSEWHGSRCSRYIGPYVVASKLEDAGFDVIIIDWFTQQDNLFEFLENFIDNNTFMFCISTTFLSPTPIDSSRAEERSAVTNRYYTSTSLWKTSNAELAEWFFQCRELLNKYNKDCKIILGGARSDLMYKYPENNTIQDLYKEVDYAIVGYAEESTIRLAKQLKSNNETPSILKNGIKFIIDNFPKNHCPSITYNPKWAIRPNESLPIEIARGCLYNCKFCYYDKKASYRKDLAELRDEFIRNYEMFGTNSYHFCDDCFNDTRQKVEETCNVILQLPFKINWISYARTDVAVKFPETLDLMIESGARALGFGVETFNREAGRRAGKGVPAEKIKQFLLDSYQKYKDKCLYHATFIVGLPGETEESQLETIEWLVNNQCLDFASFGALGVPEYKPEFDGTVSDYPDFARHPEKYGFIEIKTNPMYWRHQTMDRTKAEELTSIVNKKWLDSGNKTYLRYMWFVPMLFSLGFTWDNILDMARNELTASNWSNIVSSTFNQWLENYRKELIIKGK